MMAVADYVVSNKVNDVTTLREWCDNIGIANTNIPNIRKGTQSFTHNHILACCKAFNVDCNYLYGLSSQMFRKQIKANPFEVIKQALAEIELNAKKKR